LAGFSKIHIFPFSKRTGTAAEKLDNQINKEIITKRTKILRQLEQKLANQFRQQFVGQTVQVLIEDEAKKTGKCERYYDITVETKDALPKGEIVECLINDHLISAEKL